MSKFPTNNLQHNEEQTGTDIFKTRELVRYTHFLKKIYQADELGRLDKVECSGADKS
jgi:hypothetical protein